VPRCRGSRKKRNDPWIAGFVALFVLLVIGGLVIPAVDGFVQALNSFNPAAVTAVVVVFLLIGGTTAWFVYRWLMRHERRLAARRFAEQQTLDEERAEQEYGRWLRSADMGALDRMTGIEFEHALAQLFTDLGYGAVVTQASRDFGADIVLSRSGQKIVVQAKRYLGTLGLDAVQEASAARLHYGAVRAIVVTTSAFTAPAQSLAQTTGVELWDRQRLNEELASVAGHRTSKVVPANHGPKLDPLFARSARMVAAVGDASASLVQQKFSIDYSRAVRVVDQLADYRVIGGYQGSQSRQVLMTLPDVDDLLQTLGIE
jgi:DNA segregation ATPase FtsK/SpoIIIE-like protein